MIAEFVGSLLLSLIAGTWSPLPPDPSWTELPAPVVVAITWPGPGEAGSRTNRLIVLADGSALPSAMSSIVGPARSDRS